MNQTSYQEMPSRAPTFSRNPVPKGMFALENSKSSTFVKGIVSEQKSIFFLKKLGFSVLFQRYRTPLGEIDIVAKKGNVFHFIEVKNRKTLSDAREAISPQQKKRITNAAQFFIEHENGIQAFDSFDIQMDAIFVVENEIVFLEQAWFADDVSEMRYI